MRAVYFFAIELDFDVSAQFNRMLQWNLEVFGRPQHHPVQEDEQVQEPRRALLGHDFFSTDKEGGGHQFIFNTLGIQKFHDVQHVGLFHETVVHLNFIEIVQMGFDENSLVLLNGWNVVKDHIEQQHGLMQDFVVF